MSSSLEYVMKKLQNKAFVILSLIFLDLVMNANSEITIEDATAVARKSLSTENLRVVKFDLKAFSSEKQGYLSDQKLLTIESVVKGDLEINKTETYFVKSLASSANAYTRMMFEEEAVFYKDVVPALTSAIKNFTITEQFFPKIYLVKEGEAIIMENLKPRGYKVVKRSLSRNQLRSVMGALASFHASSMLLEESLKKPLNEVYPEHFKEKTFVRDGDGYSWKWLAAGIEVAEAIANKSGLNGSVVARAYELALEKMKPALHGGETKNVLCHGDLWTNNIMFSNESEHEADIKCVLVDYQSVSYTSHAIDVLQLLYLNSPRELRISLERELIEHYHERLEKNLRDNNYSGKVLNLEEVFQAVEDKRVCGLVTAVQFFPIALLNDGLAEEYGKDPDRLERYSYDTRTDFVLEAMEKDDVYRSRLQDAVKDLVDYFMEK